MAANNQVTIELLAEIKNAVKGFETLQKNANSTLTQIENTSKKSFSTFQKDASSNLSAITSGFKLLGGAAVAAAGLFAGKAVINAFGDFVSAAAEGQQALQNLNTVMALSGSYSKESSDDFVKFASSIQETTKFEDDLVISQLAVAKSFGISNEQAKKLVQASIELSSVTGDSLQSSVEQLGKTFSGTTGLLAKTRPELRGLSEEALKSGAAIDAVLKTLGGAAASQVQTFSGALEQSKNVFGQFGETIGSIIVDNPAVIAAITSISKIVSQLTSAFAESVPAIQQFISAVITLAFNTLPKLVSVFQFVGNSVLALREVFLNLALVFLSVQSTFLEFRVVQQAFVLYFGLIQKQILVTTQVLRSFINVLALLPGADKYLTPVADGLDSISKTIESIKPAEVFDSIKSGVDQLGQATATSLNQSDALFKSFNEGANSAKTFTEGLAKSVAQAGNNASAAASNFEKLNSSASKSSGGLGSILPSVAGSTSTSAAAAAPSASTGGASTTAAEKQGEAFSDKVSQGFSLAANTFSAVIGGGFLSSTNDFVSSLGNLPSKFIDLIGSMGSIVENLLNSLPAVGEKLVSAVPGIVTKIADALPALASKLGDVFEKLAGAIADSAPKLAEGLLDAITKLVEAVPRIVDRLVSALPKLLSAILKKLPALITAIARAIPQIIKSIATAIPEIIAVFAENLGPIILALVQGILEAIPEIILTLIDVFIVKGGLFKIIGSILKAIPQIAIALVQGIIRSAVNSTQALFGFIKNIFGGALGGVFSSLKFPSINIDGIKDFLTGKKFVDGIRDNFGEIKDVLTGKKFIDFVRENFGEIKDVLTGRKFADGVLNSVGWTTLKDVLTGKKFVDGVLANLGTVKGFLNGSLFASKIKSVFDGFSENLKKILTGGLSSAGGGGALGKVTKSLGFAQGGQAFKVPSGYNNDTFPALLSSGELVVDRSTAFALRDFLDQQNNGASSSTDSSLMARFDSLVSRMERTSEKQVSVNIQVGEKDLASVLLNLNRQGFRVA